MRFQAALCVGKGSLKTGWGIVRSKNVCLLVPIALDAVSGCLLRFVVRFGKQDTACVQAVMALGRCFQAD